MKSKIAPDQLSVYAVSDRRWLHDGQTLHAVVEELLQNGVTAVQVREKSLGDPQFLDEARDLMELCRRHRALFIVNDNAAIAEALHCGLHLGQGDMPLAEARRRLGQDAVIGISCSTVAEARLAAEQGADYLGVGAVFPTGTKSDAAAVPMAVLAGICRAVEIPVVAIGGITLDNAASLLPSGIAGWAVVSALFAATQPGQAAAAFSRIWNNRDKMES